MAAADYPQEEFDDQFLTCGICKNIYNNPRVLPCLHTFCAECLEKWKATSLESNRFICPIGREQVPLGAEGISGLPPNFYVNTNSLLDFRNLQISKRARASCQMCESEASIEGTCGDCRHLLCKNCITAHRNTPALKNHYIITLDDLKNPKSRSQYTQVKNCQKHTDQRLMFYCQPCAKLVCRDCTITEHPHGPNHDIKEVSEVAQKVKAELQTLLGQTQDTANTLKKTAGTVSMELTSITANCDEEGKKIQEHFAQLRAKLDEEERKCRDKLRKMESKQKEPLLKEKKGLEKTLRSTEEGLKSCTDVLDRGNDVEILTLRQQLGDKLDNLAQYQVQHKPLKQQISFQATADAFNYQCEMTLICKPLVLTEAPVEGLLTSIIFFLEKGQVEGSPQVTVTSPGGQCARLDTTETSEGVFEAVWRPHTSGEHQFRLMAP